MKRRKYTQSRRADKQQQTRLKIVEAAMALHEEVGPSETTVKALAERAGVQRLTVYRHFPDDASLLQACSTQWFALHPPPDLSDWESLDDAVARSHAALLAMYRYYRGTERMWQRAYRDVERVDALQGPMDRFEGHLDQVRDDLLAAWKAKAKDRSRLSLTLRHALRFSTWRSLKNEGLSDKRIADLVISWLDRK